MATKSLGTLTLDLVAKTGGFVRGMDKAERATKKGADKMSRDMKKLREDAKAWGIAVATAAAAATAALVKSQVDTAREVQRLAMLTNTATDEFQRYAAGAKAVGIDQEKLADIFKDTSDKLGDFLQTGAGPMVDFFENIAPAVGVTAEQFRNLSGPQALELYVSSLEKANVSQNEMIFYMEGIASDATLLLPLLRNGAEGFKVFGDEAERAGAIMSRSTIDASDKMAAVSLILQNNFDGLQNTLGEKLVPVFADLAVVLNDFNADGTAAVSVGETLASVVKGLAAAGVGAYAAIQLAGKAIGTLAAAADAATEDQTLAEKIIPGGTAVSIARNWSSVKGAFEAGGEDLAATVEKYGTLLDSIWEAGEGADSSANERVDELAATLKRMREMAAEGVAGESLSGSETSRQMEERLEALRQSFMTEQELLAVKYEEERELLREALEAKQLTDEEFQQLALDSKRKYEEDSTKIEEDATKARIRLAEQERRAKLAALSSTFGAISTLMNSESRRLFEIGKAAAIANATIDMYQGVMKAWALGPLLGPPLAALVAVAGVANIQGIASTSFGGGGTAAPSTSAAASASAAPVEPVNQQAQRNVYLFGLERDKLYDGQQLLDVLNDTIADGGKLAGVMRNE